MNYSSALAIPFAVAISLLAGAAKALPIFAVTVNNNGLTVTPDMTVVANVTITNTGGDSGKIMQSQQGGVAPPLYIAGVDNNLTNAFETTYSSGQSVTSDFSFQFLPPASPSAPEGAYSGDLFIAFVDSQNVNQRLDFSIDWTVSSAAVSAPATLILMGLGLAGLRWRRRQI